MEAEVSQYQCGSLSGLLTHSTVWHQSLQQFIAQFKVLAICCGDTHRHRHTNTHTHTHTNTKYLYTRNHSLKRPLSLSFIRVYYCFHIPALLYNIEEKGNVMSVKLCRGAVLTCSSNKNHPCALSKNKSESSQETVKTTGLSLNVM